MTELKFYQLKARELGIDNPSDEIDEVIEQIISYSEEPKKYIEQLEEEFEQREKLEALIANAMQQGTKFQHTREEFVQEVKNELVEATGKLDLLNVLVSNARSQGRDYTLERAQFIKQAKEDILNEK